MECEFIYTWYGENQNIPLNVYSEELLAHTMQEIAQNSSYAPSFNQFQEFLKKSFLIKNEKYFLATIFCCIDKKIVGFLMVSFAFTDVDIDFICIDSLFRRKHLAEKLFCFFEDKINEEQKNVNVFLEVGVENKAAIAFYEKIGFQKISLRKKYYKNNENAVVMKKCL